jgi:lipoprotein-releasing system ATP-binding protein
MGNLDTQGTGAVFAPLRRVNPEQGAAVLWVTHNPQLGQRCVKTIQVVDGLIQT